MPSTFATLAQPGTWQGQGTGSVLVGRLVANAELFTALFRYSSFDRFLFFAGEQGDVNAVRASFIETGILEEKRLEIRNLLALPQSLASNDISVLHAASYSGNFLDLCWLRDRYATRTVPVTAQVHSLSYPRDLLTFLRARVLPPSPCDAILCTSDRGKSALLAGEHMIGEGVANEIGLAHKGLACEFPVIPLGVELDALRGGDGASVRARHGIPEDAIVVLSIGRFSEYDKQDLFPVVAAFHDALARAGQGRPLFLLLAGARQGTQTPEMVSLWARALGIADRVKLEIDFPSTAKKDLLAAADLFLAASDNPQETFGLSVVEAMAAGKAVIASDYDGYRDTIPDGAGVRIPTTICDDLSFARDLTPILYERPLHLFAGQALSIDSEKLAITIAALSRDESLRATLGKAARDHAASRFDWRVVIKELESLWLSLAKKPFRKLPESARHPLGLDFARMFAGYPTGALLPTDRLASTPLAREMCDAELRYPIYPEEKNVVRAADVLLLHKAISEVKEGLPASELQAALRAFLGPKEEWRAGPTIAWMIKHALLAKQ